MLSLKSKGINIKTIAQYSRRIFAISQMVPNAVINLLQEKKKRELTEKQQREIYEHIKQKNIFPTITNPKMLMELCSDLELEFYKEGKILFPDEHCYIIIDGAVKIYEEILTEPELNQQIQQIRKTSVIITSATEQTRIQQKKIVFGQVIAFQQLSSSKLIYITAFPTLMIKIPHKIHSIISSTTYMAQLKRKQQFFSSIPLFQKHYRWSLQDFVNSLSENQFGFGKKIFNEGQIIDKIYIVKQGQFLLQKNVNCDEVIVKQGKLKQKTQQDQNLQKNIQSEIKLTTKHYRSCPYKIIGPKQIIGDSQFMYNDRKYLCSMRCHKEGSVLYSINVQSFFKKLLVAQNTPQRVNNILQANFEIRKKQIESGVKFNQQNSLILRFFPNSGTRYKAFNSSSKERGTSWVKSKNRSQTIQNSQRSSQFFEQMNKTIINQNHRSIRKRNDSKQLQVTQSQKAKRKIFKTPAVVQQIVHIVNQKRAYHKLRNLGVQKKGAFQFDIDNVPPFIKKKYGHITNKKNL